MNSAIDPKTKTRERRALVKSKFSLADALAMCGHDRSVRSNPDLDDPCPCCGVPGLTYFDDTRPRGHQRVDDVKAATIFECEACTAAGDAITYVLQASGRGNPDRNLDAIEQWLSGRMDPRE